jgi:hypothetical protein
MLSSRERRKLSYKGKLNDFTGQFDTDTRIDSIVYRHCWRRVATPQAGNIPDRDVLRGAAGKCALQFLPQLVGSQQVTGHVATNLDIRFRRRRQAEVRIETGYGVKLTDGFLKLLRQFIELAGREIPVNRLNSSEFIEQGELLPFADARE